MNRLACGAILWIWCAAFAQAGGETGFRRYGYMEYARIMPGDLRVRAKLDTGADISSIHASDLVSFKRGGRSWARFAVFGEDGHRQVLEREVVDTVRVRNRRGRDALRPVVVLPVCVGDRSAWIEVSLSDRSELSCPLLLGRNFLRNDILVDAGDAFTASPVCVEPKP